MTNDGISGHLARRRRGHRGRVRAVVLRRAPAGAGSGVPGFVAGRRYEAVTGAPRFLTYYEGTSPEVFVSKFYMDRLNDPTPLSTRVLRHFRDTNRDRLPADLGGGRDPGAWGVAVRVDRGGSAQGAEREGDGGQERCGVPPGCGNRAGRGPRLARTSVGVLGAPPPSPLPAPTAEARASGVAPTGRSRQGSSPTSPARPTPGPPPAPCVSGGPAGASDAFRPTEDCGASGARSASIGCSASCAVTEDHGEGLRPRTASGRGGREGKRGRSGWPFIFRPRELTERRAAACRRWTNAGSRPAAVQAGEHVLPHRLRHLRVLLLPVPVARPDGGMTLLTRAPDLRQARHTSVIETCGRGWTKPAAIRGSAAGGGGRPTARPGSGWGWSSTPKVSPRSTGGGSRRRSAACVGWKTPPASFPSCGW